MAHLDPQRKVEVGEAHNQEEVAELEDPHQGVEEVAVVVEYQHGQEVEEVVEPEEEEHLQVEVGEEVVEEGVEQLHLLVRALQQVQLDQLQSGRNSDRC